MSKNINYIVNKASQLEKLNGKIYKYNIVSYSRELTLYSLNSVRELLMTSFKDRAVDIEVELRYKQAKEAI